MIAWISYYISIQLLQLYYYFWLLYLSKAHTQKLNKTHCTLTSGRLLNILSHFILTLHWVPLLMEKIITSILIMIHNLPFTGILLNDNYVNTPVSFFDVLYSQIILTTLTVFMSNYSLTFYEFLWTSQSSMTTVIQLGYHFILTRATVLIHYTSLRPLRTHLSYTGINHSSLLNTYTLLHLSHFFCIPQFLVLSSRNSSVKLLMLPYFCGVTLCNTLFNTICFAVI